MKRLIVVLGPTASGKTATAINLAKLLACDVVSADSRQVFQEMRIGTARPSDDELQGVNHHFLGHISISETYTAGRFAQEANAWILDYFKTHDTLVLCGGTGLYIKALLEGIDRKPVSEEIRLTVRQIQEERGLEGIHQALTNQGVNLDYEPEKSNPQRMMRLLEWVLAGKPESQLEPLPTNWIILKIGLELPREKLYERINLRVDKMVVDGLFNEAESLYPNKSLNALQTVGYQEIFDYLDGKMTQGQAIEKIKQHTRNYAKRQMTWFRKDSEIRWFDPENQEGIEEAVLAVSHGA